MSEDRKLWKITLCGSGAVGKTTLRKRYLGESFEANYMSTVGADFSLYETKINSTNVAWQIWDLAGQPLFSDVIKSYYHKIFGSILIYDITRRKTFEEVENWVNDIHKNSTREKPVPVILVANKIDLRDSAESVSTEEGEALAKKLGIPFLETSAKTGDGVKKAFELLGQAIAEYTK